MRLEADIRSTFTDDGVEPFTVDAALEVANGETLVVLGPSGSGKTLLLEAIAGFHDHEGYVRIGGREVTDAPPEDRGLGFVFQDYALFPHLTVRENVAFGDRYHEETRDPDELLASLGVADLAERSPPTLSGGERQRVALARSLAVDPGVMLLDEPLSALDVPTRQSLRNDLATALDAVTGAYVTHNRTTARALADRIAVMHDGRIVQRGTPEAVFERPESPMVARFTGANAIDLAAAPTLRERLDGRPDGHVAIRPEVVVLDGADGDIRATVERTAREDATTRVTCSFDDVTVEAFTDDPPPAGTEVWVTFPRSALHRC
ncbi:MAG: ABC transporter ATP-binding protein [Haloglomus sp.]